MKRAPLATGTFLALSIGCVHAPPKLPPADTVTIGGEKAQYRDLSKVQGLCDLSGREYAGELQSVNTLLASFLSKTEAPPDGKYSAEQVDALQQGLDQLPKVVDVQEKNVNAGSRCPDMDPALLVSDTSRHAKDLIKKTRERLDGANQVVTAEKQRLAVEAWKKQQVAAEKSARESWCPPKLNPAKMPDIYFALQDEQGRTSYLFCDGARVFGSEGNQELIPPANTPKKKLHHSEKQYFAETQKFPSTEIQRPPGAAGAPSKDSAQGGGQ